MSFPGGPSQKVSNLDCWPFWDFWSATYDNRMTSVDPWFDPIELFSFPYKLMAELLFLPYTVAA